MAPRKVKIKIRRKRKSRSDLESTNKIINEELVTKKDTKTHIRKKRRKGLEDQKILIYNDATVKEIVLDAESKESQITDEAQKKDFVTEKEFLEGEGF